jgi:hypothetical protein
MHAFGGIEEPQNVANFDALMGSVMTEAPMQGIAITDSTLDDIRKIHEDCVTVQGQLVP